MNFLSKEIERFWTWFKDNEERFFNDIERKKIAELFEEITWKITEIDRGLVFEFGLQNENRKKEFILSSNGNKKLFSLIEEIYSKAPELNYFEVKKFRQRKDVDENLIISANNMSLKISSLKFRLFEDGEKTGIIVFVKDLPKNKEKRLIYVEIVFLFLDALLGEYDVATKIGLVLVEDSKCKANKNSNRLINLLDDYNSDCRTSKHNILEHVDLGWYEN